MIRFVLSTLILLAAIPVSGCGGGASAGPGEIVLLNVSYDPTRELWKDLNAEFSRAWSKDHAQPVRIKQSHAASGSQARAVIDGLEADVVTLALWSDTNQIHKQGLISAGWEDDLPHRSLAYTSTIVMVVRKGNPKGIRDWDDLRKPGVAVITPNPKTSGNGKLAFLAMWGHVLLGGGTEEKATEFVRAVYKAVPVLDTGARGATTTFAQKGQGDVHLTWESEAYLEVEESGGSLEIVYPARSIRAEPHLAVVDANVDRRKTREAAEAYLNFLYTPAGQEVIARHYYRPVDETVLEKHRAKFPKIELFEFKDLGGTLDELQQRFFADGGVFDAIYAGGPRS